MRAFPRRAPPMTDRWTRLQELFDALVVRPRETWDGWLASVEPDTALRAEAVALASADRTTGDLGRQIGRIAATAVEPEPAAGMIVGAYRLVSEIGAGGMGSVFLAERVDAAFDRRVAVKLLRGVPTRSASERLRRERQILADLRHPNIARLLDGGTTQSGQPYLVLEYVDGSPIGAWCRERALGVEARLRLVQTLCRAVHYAHQHLVIHRDIKPGNVLVNADGEPVLLDFGIAKLLDDTGDATHTARAWMTPAYASPEQRRGEPLSTATDVYGLGVVLYELLTGRMPPATGEPLQRASDGAPAAITARLRGDVDRIVAKATHEDAPRRYASAEALADDIARHLSGHPVLAASDSLRYRAAKFARRHRWGVAAAALAFVLSIVFVRQLALERDRARAAEAAARIEAANSDRVTDYLVSVIENASPDDTGRQPIPPLDMVDTAWKQLDGKLVDQPFQRARLLVVLGGVYNAFGAYERSLDGAAEAVAIERRRAPGLRLAQALHVLGVAQGSRGRYDDALASVDEAVSIFDAMPDAPPDALTRALVQRAFMQSRTNRPEAALVSALDAERRAAQADDPVLWRVLALNAASEAQRSLGRTDDALATAERALATLQADPVPRPILIGHAHGFIGRILLAQNQPAEAEARYREAVTHYVPVTRREGPEQTNARALLAQALERQGRVADAVAVMEESLAIGRDAGEGRALSQVRSLCLAGRLYALHGDDAKAQVRLREGLDIGVQTGADEAAASADCGVVLTCLLARGGDAEGANAVDAKVADRDDAIRRNRAICRAEIARVHGDLDAALARLAEAKTLVNAGARDATALVEAVEGAVLRERGELAASAQRLRGAIENLSRWHGANANPTVLAKLELAKTLRQMGDAAATTLIEELAVQLPAQFAKDSKAARDLAAMR